ncbi:fibronectin type III domain-containing protein [Candidatus Woesearchaeota archaeon]|nr:fibronectin type III domain-containing protein [Candidatus Woesearchaeota archaeon]
MVNETIVKFIREHISQGYTIEQIKDYLLKYGFKSNNIDEAVDFVRQQPFDSKFGTGTAGSSGADNSLNANPRLVKYVQENLAKGYNIDDIRSYLIQSGYDAGIIEQAIQSAQLSAAQSQYSQQPKHVKHIVEIHPRTIMHIFLLLIVIGGLVSGGYYLFFKLPQSPELLDYTIQIDSSDIKPGEKLYFINKITNMGEKNRYDIFIEFKIINKDTLDELTSWSKTFAIDVVVDKPESVLIPKNTAAGRYILSGTVHYGDTQNKASNSFKVLSTEKEPSCFDGIKNQDEKGIDCGGKCNSCESCFDNVQNQNEIDVDCGGVCKLCETCFDNTKNQDEEGIDCGGVCKIPCKEEEVTEGEISETPETTETTPKESSTETETPSEEKLSGGVNFVDKLLDAKETSKKNPDKAVQMCKELSISSSIDQCVTDVAKNSNQSKYCEDIVNGKKKDSCYLSFALSFGEYSNCEKIKDPTYKDSCVNLQKLSVLQSTYGISGEKGKTLPATETQITETPNIDLPKELLPTQPEKENLELPPKQPSQPQQPSEPKEGTPQPSQEQPSQPSPEASKVQFNNIEAIKVDYTTYKITWTTNIATKSIVKYGKVQSYLSDTAYDLTETTQHEIIIKNLKTSQKYYYQVVYLDAQGNVVSSEVLSFETKV